MLGDVSRHRVYTYMLGGVLCVLSVLSLLQFWCKGFVALLLSPVESFSTVAEGICACCLVHSLTAIHGKGQAYVGKGRRHGVPICICSLVVLTCQMICFVAANLTALLARELCCRQHCAYNSSVGAAACCIMQHALQRAAKCGIVQGSHYWRCCLLELGTFLPCMQTSGQAGTYNAVWYVSIAVEAKTACIW
jgi:hypothetical protein